MKNKEPCDHFTGTAHDYENGLGLVNDSPSLYELDTIFNFCPKCGKKLNNN